MVKVYNLCRVKTDRSAVLTVKSSLDPHMIIKLKDEFKMWFPMVLRYGYKCLIFGVGINLHLVIDLLIKFDQR